jgi:TP53 regulating kinase-like protein
VLVKLATVGERRVDGGKEVVVPGVYAVEWDVGRKVKGLEQQMKGERGRGAWILMEWIEGWSVKDLLRDCDRLVKGGEVNEQEEKVMEENVRGLLRRIGRAVGVLHAKGGVVHGDLTTSNVMVRPVVRDTTTNGDVSLRDSNGKAGEGETGASSIFSQPYEIVLIDFGLATQSIQDEDRAVDLYVLERAFGSTHPRQEGWFDQEVLQSQEGYRGAWGGSKVALKRLEDVRLRGRKRTMVG